MRWRWNDLEGPQHHFLESINLFQGSSVSLQHKNSYHVVQSSCLEVSRHRLPPVAMGKLTHSDSWASPMQWRRWKTRWSSVPFWMRKWSWALAVGAGHRNASVPPTIEFQKSHTTEIHPRKLYKRGNTPDPVPILNSRRPAYRQNKGYNTTGTQTSALNRHTHKLVNLWW